ncbi:MAG: DUF2306 domain-containing protein [Pseudomonadota bacterium]
MSLLAPEGPGLGPLLAEGPVVAAHAAAALAALGLGAAQLYGPKGTRGHRLWGRVWVALMALVALSSFAIFQLRLIGPFSPIHGLSLYTLASLLYALRAARRGDIRAHRLTMASLFWFALIVAGAFTFFPGRAMHAVVFGV